MRIAILLAAVALAACGQSEPEVDARNASVGEVAEQVREATGESNFIRPGRWVSQSSFQEIEAPGMPANVREQMKGMMARQDSFETCLTEEDAKRPKEDFFAGKDNQCRYDHFTMGGGKIDARMSCGRGGVSQIIELVGTYSPDAYQMTTSIKSEGAPGPAGNVSMKMRVDARRVGECNAKQA